MPTLPTLDRYLAQLFLARFFGVLLFLVAALQTLDLLNHSDYILSADGADWRSLFDYAALRAPHLAARFAPFAALLAVLLTFAALDLGGEFVIMRGAGLSALRLAAPLMLACAATAVALFFFHDVVAVEATRRLDDWRSRHFALPMRAPPPGRTELWGEDAGAVVHARLAGDGGALEDLTILEFGADGKFRAIMRARLARPAADARVLYDVKRFDATNLSVVAASARRWDTTIFDRDFAPEPEHATFRELERAAAAHGDDGSSAALRSALFFRIAAPAALLLMPLIAAATGFGFKGRGAVTLRLVAGLGIGFSYFVVQNLMLALGQFGVIAPLAAAFAPPALYLAGALTAIFHHER